MKKLAASVNMPPALEMYTLGVLTLEQIVVKLVVCAVWAMAFQMGFTLSVQIGFISGNTAVWTG
jgi:hypothetical protein